MTHNPFVTERGSVISKDEFYTILDEFQNANLSEAQKKAIQR